MKPLPESRLTSFGCLWEHCNASLISDDYDPFDAIEGKHPPKVGDGDQVESGARNHLAGPSRPRRHVREVFVFMPLPPKPKEIGKQLTMEFE
jgi:hypothetical protein